MKKNTIKAFTLVEMLIVIVIIGILIASLMPRMQSAQGRARDVARKNDLAQIQTAIIASQTDKWKWPQLNSGATEGMAIGSGIEQDLINAGMSSMPRDPNGSNYFDWLWDLTTWQSVWSYGYMVATRNGISNWWFVLMAKTETEWWSNWVTCSAGTWWHIEKTDDLKNIQTCTKLDYQKGGTCQNSGWNCVYTATEELRYILLY